MADSADSLPSPDQDAVFMRRALELAANAGGRGEVPVGAVLVVEGRIVGEGSNAQIQHCDPSAHAEVLALRDAGQALQNYRLPGSTLYVTLEPCSMCCGAMVHARVGELVFAAAEPRAGAVVSTQQLLDTGSFNHHVRWRRYPEGEAASAELLRGFFRARR